LGLCPNSLGVGALRGPNVRENVMKYKGTKLDGSVNQPKIELHYETLRFMTHVTDLRLLVMQDRFGILRFIYYCLLIKLNLFNYLLPLSNYYNLYIAFL